MSVKYHCKRMGLLLAALSFFASARALPTREPRHYLQTLWNSIPDKENVIKAGGEWFPYPDYSDRDAWNKLTEGKYEELVKAGEKAMKDGMEFIPATVFLECERAKKQELTFPTKRNFARVSDLMMAELAEGKGRFIPALVDALWYMSERSTWMNPYNSKRGKKKPLRQLPDPDDRYISLNAADAASRIAIAWHFFHEEFDKIDPVISRVVSEALDRNTFTPYLDATKDKYGHSWLGFNGDRSKGRIVNNWNTHCNVQVLLAFLLVEQNQQRLLEAMDKGIRSLDCYLDYVWLDGCCDEGPSYWDMAGGKVYDFARMICDASKGKFNIFSDDQVRRICEFKAYNYIGDNWVVNFADGLPFDSGDTFLPYRMGIDFGSDVLKDFGLTLLAGKSGEQFASPRLPSGYRGLESLRYWSMMLDAEKKALADAGGSMDALRASLMKKASSIYYPDTDVAYLRNGKGWMLAAKGGYNNESHNHNDVGSALLFIDNCPVIVDLGCQVYGPDTFGPRRYTLYQNRSDWHNIVDINGCQQKDGVEFGAGNSSCDTATCFFTTDVAGAYPQEAACKSWVRSYTLDGNSLVIKDKYELSERTASDSIFFITAGKVTVNGRSVTIETSSRDGSRSVAVSFNVPKGLTISVETKDITDTRHLKAWGKQVHRIVLASSPKAPLKGSYSIKFTRLR